MGYIICMGIIALLLLALLLNNKKTDAEKLNELKRENEALKDRENEREEKRQHAQKAKQDARTGDPARDLDTIAHRMHKLATGNRADTADN